MGRRKRRKKTINALRITRTNKRVTFEEYQLMYSAYKEDQTAEHVSGVTGIAYNTCRKYILKGDPKRYPEGFWPISEKFKDWADGNAKKMDLRSRDIVRRRAQQATTITEGIYEKMKGTEKADGSRHLEITKEQATPSGFFGAAFDELKLHNIHETKESEAEGGEVRYIIDLTDPQYAAIMEDRLKKFGAEMIAAGIREVVNVLDPDGSKKLVHTLPIPLQTIVLLDPSDPQFKHQAAEFARKVGGFNVAEETVVDADVEDADGEDATPKEPTE